MRNDRTWIVVMDSAQARVFELVSTREGRQLRPATPAMISELGRHARDERSDKPGRSLTSTASGLRHAIEPRHDFHKLAKHAFARAISAALKDSLDAGRFDNLVLVAPRRTIGELRLLLEEKVRGKITKEIPKDLTQASPANLWQKIAPIVLPFATDRTARIARSEPKGKPAETPILNVEFRGMDPSSAVKASVERRAAKVLRNYPQTTACRTVVERLRGRQNKGPLYLAFVDLGLPGTAIRASSAAGQNHAQENVFAAIRDAFDAASHQLKSNSSRKLPNHHVRDRASAS